MATNLKIADNQIQVEDSNGQVRDVARWELSIELLDELHDAIRYAGRGPRSKRLSDGRRYYW